MDKSSDEMKNRNPHQKLPQSFWNFSDKNAAEIQHEIRTTRAELDETINAIQARLAPQQMINHFADVTRDVIRQGSPKVLEAIRNNPLPISLVVVGLGWLFIRGSAGPQRRVRLEYGPYGGIAEDEYGLAGESQSSTGGAIESSYEKGKDWTSEKAQRVKDKTGQWTEQAKDKASHLAGQVKSKTGQWTGQAKDKASHLAGQARDKAGDMADNVMHRAGRMASQMAEATRDAASHFAGTTMETAGHLADATKSKAGDLAQATVDMTGSVAHAAGEQARQLGTATRKQLQRAGAGTHRMYRENPGAFALLCVGIGAALAMSLPTTRKEQEMMGEKSESLKQQLKQTGQEALGKVENIVEAGREAMSEEARKENVI